MKSSTYSPRKQRLALQPGTAPAPDKSPLHTGPQQVRIIGGQWRRTPLPVTQRAGLRPTPARLRETLFNWLGHDLSRWRCIDAFAGTGALGLEAASRGAAQVTLVEQDAAQVSQLRAVVQRLQAQDRVQVLRGDGVQVLSGWAARSVDLVLLDPPFTADLYAPALAAAARAITTTGWIYLEAAQPWVDAQVQPWGLRVYRYTQAGAVHAHLLRRTA